MFHVVSTCHVVQHVSRSQHVSRGKARVTWYSTCHVVQDVSHGQHVSRGIARVTWYSTCYVLTWRTEIRQLLPHLFTIKDRSMTGDSEGVRDFVRDTLVCLVATIDL